MSKILRILVSIAIIIIISIIVTRTVQYCNLPKANSYVNNNLTYNNYAIQIAYNIIYLIVAVLVLGTAYFQLSKTREATTVQTLSDIDFKIRSDGFVKKRKKLAKYITDETIAGIATFLMEIKDQKTLNPDQTQRIATIKNHIEDVIYQFEFIGYYYHKRIFSIEDIYQLFSIEIQQYWLIVQKMGFVKYLRNNKMNPNSDYYDKFESLFEDTLKQEIINDSYVIWRWAVQIYYWAYIYKPFYCLFSKRKNKLSKLIKQKQRTMDLFLTEEKNLIET